MNRSRLKNIIIIILLLLNGFLLGSLAFREAAVRAARSRTAEQLTALFAKDDMILYADAISSDTPPAALSFSRDSAREAAVAAFFLGNAPLKESEQDSLHITYVGENGTATFRSNGSFEFSGKLSQSDAEAVCRSFCRTFSYEEPTFDLTVDGTGSAAAIAVYNALPVYNCTVTFALENGTLTSVSGTLLPSVGTAAQSRKDSLSAPAALVAFQQYRKESGASASAITGTALCYELQTSAVSLSLSPSWCIETDIAKYYVNCFTGTVSAG